MKYRLYQRITVLLLLLACALGFCSCGSPSGTDDFSSATKDYPVTVEGTVLKKAPQRVAIFSPSLADIILELGDNFAIKLRGKSEDCVQEELDSLESLGTVLQPNLQKIAEQKIDLLLTDQRFSDEIMSQLKDAGVSVVVLPIASNREELEWLFQCVGASLMGAKTGSRFAEQRVKKLLMSVDDIIRLSGTEGKNKRVCFILDEQGTMVEKSAWGGLILEYAGGINIAADEKAQPMNPDELAMVNPDYIFCAEGLKEKLLQRSEFASLDAVKKGNIVELPVRYVLWQGKSILEGVKTITDILYGNR